jgi:hypothetical protein
MRASFWKRDKDILDLFGHQVDIRHDSLLLASKANKRHGGANGAETRLLAVLDWLQRKS